MRYVVFVPMVLALILLASMAHNHFVESEMKTAGGTCVTFNSIANLWNRYDKQWPARPFVYKGKTEFWCDPSDFPAGVDRQLVGLVKL